MAYRTIRLTSWPAVAGTWLVLVCSANGQQPPTSLEDLFQKSPIAAADRQRIEDRFDEWIHTMTSSTASQNTRETAKSRIATAITTSGPAFRDAAADVLSRSVTLQTALGGGNADAAIMAGTLLIDVVHPAFSGLFPIALGSRIAAVRYLGAKGALLLQGQLTQPADYRAMIKALQDAGQIEKQVVVLKMIYRALTYPDNFAGADDVVAALIHIFNARLKAGLNHPDDDLLGYTAAARAGAAVSQPPVALMERLARMLKLQVQSATDNQSPVSPAAIEACEEAIRALMGKFPGATAPPKVADLARKNPSDHKAIAAGVAAYIGAKDKPGALNDPPWKLPPGLP